MSLGTAFGAIIIGGIILLNNTPEAREINDRRALKEAMKCAEKLLEPMRKQDEKIHFITNFIDEIPDLSYYEAAQLKKKLGNIYLEWNDE